MEGNSSRTIEAHRFNALAYGMLPDIIFSRLERYIPQAMWRALMSSIDYIDTVNQVILIGRGWK